MLSHSVMSKSLPPRGLWPTRLLYPWVFSRQEYWSGLPCLSPGDLPNPGIEPSCPAFQADSLPSEPPEKPKNTGVGSLLLLQGIFPTQELNRGSLHCRQILYQLSYQGSPREQYKGSSKKLKLELPYDPGTPIMGIYLEKTIIQKEWGTPMFTAAQFK